MLTNVVAGRHRPASTGSALTLVDPSTGTTSGHTVNSRQSDVDEAMTAAASAFPRWRRSTPAERQRALLALADALESGAETFADAEIRETGKPRRVVLDEEIPECVSALRFFAGAARLLEGTAATEYAPGHTSFVRREPVGVCAQIAPWNYPLMMAVWKIAPALAAGNTVVLKPAETTPSTAVLLAETAAEQLPPGTFNVVLGDRDTGRALVSHPLTDLVSITGSTRAGIDVATTAAADLKRTHLELGGNAPLLVFGDVDVAETAEGICAAAFYNAGQDCTAASRVLAHESVYDELVAALTKAAAGTRTATADADFGPLNSAAQLSRVQGLIDRLGDHAELRTGGRRAADHGFFFSPTVIANLRQDDEIVQEEIFGPVITVQRFASEAEAVALANDVRYGLAASVWTRDHARALRVSAELDFGCVWVNTHGPLVLEMPHGGFRHSGHGKDLSAYSFAEYTRVKHVMSRL
ncbi:aminobutyraldehyde dehydrogenase [Prauserella muralis]|uniref:Gamma-aminobutyraldehyde dehydrogenase n=1 Tax=Prauserella muralis TaxID=588067 RepID=A0A2V4B1M7_9PSEU|nr:aminobutyraldehyde dehydrogenase [Prauserella muralis]PXY28171.1 gamma-aminobutyraldehyde dehydrogenase [Prauserella muralis]TWE22018.1 1-pyrroline dehydrogenase [Prauserella muralis]